MAKRITRQMIAHCKTGYEFLNLLCEYDWENRICYPPKSKTARFKNHKTLNRYFAWFNYHHNTFDKTQPDYVDEEELSSYIDVLIESFENQMEDSSDALRKHMAEIINNLEMQKQEL